MKELWKEVKLDSGLKGDKGYYANIVQELLIEDVAGFREMFRMKPADFYTILR